MSDSTATFIEDDYGDFHEEEVVYGDIDWDSMPAELVSRHDSLLVADGDELVEAAESEEDDFLRWALARAAGRVEDHGTFEKVCERILAGTQTSPYIDYPAVRLAVARHRLAVDDIAAALSALDAYLDDVGPEASTTRRLAHDSLKGLVLLHGDAEQRASARPHLCSVATDAVGEEPELVFDLSEQLADAGHIEITRDLLQAALTTARGSCDSSIVSELELRLRLAQR